MSERIANAARSVPPSGTGGPRIAEHRVLGPSGAGGLMKRLAAIAGATLFGVLVTAAPASAHTTLIWSDPGKDSTVTTSPAQVRLTFADPVRFPGVVVTDARGGHHEKGRPSAVDNHVAQQISGVLPPGVYTVGWRVVAEDGHPVSGQYRFTVKGDASSASSSPAPTTPAAWSATETARPKQTSGSGWWWIGLVVVVLGLGGGGVAFLRRRGGGS